MLNDFKSAWRQFTNAPGITLAIVASLAIGIAANTVVFSWIHAVFLEPVPGVKNGADLKLLHPQTPRYASYTDGRYLKLSWSEYLDVRERQKSFTDLIATAIRPLCITDSDGQGRRIWTETVSGNYFQFLDVKPILGRVFGPEEATQPGTSPVIVLSYAYWQKYLNGDADVIGRTLVVNGRELKVIGVLPEAFQGSSVGLGMDMWIPNTFVSGLFPRNTELTDRTIRHVAVLGRLKPGVTAPQAEEELKAIYADFAAHNPKAYEGVTVDLKPFWQNPQGAQRMMLPALGTLQVLSFLVLLLTCVTSGILLLARATVREKEISVRLALGASRRQILRQLLTESVAIALCGSLCGVLLAFWGLHLLKFMPVPNNYPVKLVVSIRPAEFLYAAVVALGCGLVCGLAPAVQLARSNLVSALKAGSGRGMGTSARRWWRSLLIGAQVCVALIVLIMAGLFLKSYYNSQALDPGFNAQNVLVATLDMTAQGYDSATAQRFVRDLLPRLRALPDVESATVAAELPLDLIERALPGPIRVAGPGKRPASTIQGLNYKVAPSYFQTMGIPFVEGADFPDFDDAKAEPTAIINEELARLCWPGQSPIGATVTNRKLKIIGVVRTAKYVGLNENPTPMLYLSMRDTFSMKMTLLVRTRKAPLTIEPAVQRIVAELAPTLPLDDVRTLAQHVDSNLFLIRMPAWMLLPLGPVALVLAWIGIYSVISYSVVQRTQEIGVRLAMGATPKSVVRLIVRQGMTIVAVAGAIGLYISYGFSRSLTATLVDVPAGDPPIFLLVVTLLSAIAAVACWAPARYATKVNPIDALRVD